MLKLPKEKKPLKNSPIDFMSAKGVRYRLKYGSGVGKTAAFEAGKPRRFVIDNEGAMVAVTGKVRFANGQEAYAVLEIDEMSSGEHCGTGIILPDGSVTFQGDVDFLRKLKLTAKDVYPYKYMYDVELHCNDHHAGAVEWSRV